MDDAMYALAMSPAMQQAQEQLEATWRAQMADPSWLGIYRTPAQEQPTPVQVDLQPPATPCASPESRASS